jgi:hypothetical protein
LVFLRVLRASVVIIAFDLDLVFLRVLRASVVIIAFDLDLVLLRVLRVSVVKTALDLILCPLTNSTNPTNSTLGFEKPVSFRVDTPAVLLPVHAESCGFGHARVPAVTKVGVVKRDPCRFPDGLTDGYNGFVILKFAVEQGRGKKVEFASFGNQGGRFKPAVVTDAAAVGLAENSFLKKTFKIIAFLDNQVKVGLIRVGLQGFLSFEALCERVDVVAIIKTHYLQPFFTQRIYREN